MIPISLYVMIELLKIILASWIKSDKDLEDEKGKCDVRNSNILEEMG